MELPALTIGRYTLKPGIEPGKIWIETDEGEGGDFPIEQVEALLAKFYEEHF